MVPTLKILAVAMVIRSFGVIASTLFNALGLPRLSYQMHIARAALMAVTICPLAALVGLEGVAAAVLVGVLGAAIVYIGTLRSTLGLSWTQHFARLPGA